MTQEFRLPDIGEGLTEADIIEWFVAVGDTVEVDQPIVEVETAKTTVEITATHAGTVIQANGAPGDTVAVGDVLFVIGEAGAQSAPAAATLLANTPNDTHATATAPHTTTEREPARQTIAHTGAVRAMPIVRKLAKERGIDLAGITGTGPRGAITRADLDAIDEMDVAAEVVPMTAKRRAIAHHMATSWASIPHVTVQADIRAENLLGARVLADDTTLSLEAIVGSVVVPLLLRHREFNAVVHDDAVEYRQHVHLGIAVDTVGGLMVVVVRDAQTLSVRELDTQIESLASAAQAGTLRPDDAVGQTFTISNIGALGGGHGTPIIPLGTSAIVSIGRARETPVVQDGDLAVGLVAPIDLSYDHRLIDGSIGQRFLADLVTALEAGGQPESA